MDNVRLALYTLEVKWIHTKGQELNTLNYWHLKNTCVLPVGVQQFPGSDDGFDQGVGPHHLLRRCLGAGVRLSALLVPHGFNIAAAPHPTTRDLIILPAARVTSPVILGHLSGMGKVNSQWNNINIFGHFGAEEEAIKTTLSYYQCIKCLW